MTFVEPGANGDGADRDAVAVGSRLNEPQFAIIAPTTSHIQFPPSFLGSDASTRSVDELFA